MNWNNGMVRYEVMMNNKNGMNLIYSAYKIIYSETNLFQNIWVVEEVKMSWHEMTASWKGQAGSILEIKVAISWVDVVGYFKARIEV